MANCLSNIKECFPWQSREHQNVSKCFPLFPVVHIQIFSMFSAARQNTLKNFQYFSLENQHTFFPIFSVSGSNGNVNFYFQNRDDAELLNTSSQCVFIAQWNFARIRHNKGFKRIQKNRYIQLNSGILEKKNSTRSEEWRQRLEII